MRFSGDTVVRRLVAFGRLLRAGGLEVGPGRLQNAIRALGIADLSDRDEMYWSLRCTLVSREEDLGVFDAAFAAFWEQTPLAPAEHRLPRALDHGDEAPPAAGQGGADARPETHGEDAADGDDGAERDVLLPAWSADELLRDRDFASYGPDELRRARRLVERVADASPRRRSRRLERAARGSRLDERRTLRSSLRTSGLPFERAWRRPKSVPRKLVFLVDVSGSMEPYTRAMVMFLQAAVGAGRHVEAFTFGTRLTRLTPHLAGRDPDRALARAARAVPDWAGGTRIGENLKAFNDIWGRRGLTRGAIVVVVSDGWERGDPGLLSGEMERLRRAAHTLVWVNPLAGEPGYRPLVAGMVAALPHVDVFLPGHNLRSLETLAEVLESVGSRPKRRTR